jgi:hypothetical protein
MNKIFEINRVTVFLIIGFLLLNSVCFAQKDTLTFKHVKGSSVFSEILIPLTTMILFPLTFVVALIITPFKVRTKRYKKLYL